MKGDPNLTDRCPACKTAFEEIPDCDIFRILNADGSVFLALHSPCKEVLLEAMR